MILVYKTEGQTDLFILVGGDSYEGCLVKGVRVEGVPPHGEDVVGLHHVHTGLVLVHRVQNDLLAATKESR